MEGLLFPLPRLCRLSPDLLRRHEELRTPHRHPDRRPLRQRSDRRHRTEPRRQGMARVLHRPYPASPHRARPRTERVHAPARPSDPGGTRVPEVLQARLHPQPRLHPPGTTVVNGLEQALEVLHPSPHRILANRQLRPAAQCQEDRRGWRGTNTHRTSSRAAGARGQHRQPLLHPLYARRRDCHQREDRQQLA